MIAFSDPDGLPLEIVGHAGAEARSAWDGGRGVSREHAIRGLHGITLWVEALEPTERVLVDTLGFRPVRDDDATRRYAVGGGGPGTVVDIRTTGGFGRGAEGAGTVHHVAFAVAADASQLAVRARVAETGLQPTPVIDRTYFHSVYFREPARILYELATIPPGFAVDEPLHQLGERLALPPPHEPHRAEIEAVLPPLHRPDVPNAGSLFADLTSPEDDI